MRFRYGKMRLVLEGGTLYKPFPHNVCYTFNFFNLFPSSSFFFPGAVFTAALSLIVAFVVVVAGPGITDSKSPPLGPSDRPLFGGPPDIFISDPSSAGPLPLQNVRRTFLAFRCVLDCLWPAASWATAALVAVAAALAAVLLALAAATLRGLIGTAEIAT